MRPAQFVDVLLESDDLKNLVSYEQVLSSPSLARRYALELGDEGDDVPDEVSDVLMDEFRSWVDRVTDPREAWTALRSEPVSVMDKLSKWRVLRLKDMEEVDAGMGKLKSLIATDSRLAYEYAKQIKARFRPGEAAIAKNPRYAYHYSLQILRKESLAGRLTLDDLPNEFRHWFDVIFDRPRS